MLAPVADVWWRPFSIAGEVAILYVDLTLDPAREAEAFAWLDERERLCWERYLPGPRRRFSLCRAALRATLCDQLDCRNDQLSFSASRHGKPFAVVQGAQSSLNFNVSHSNNHGLIACSFDRRVGVDIEERSPKHNIAGLIEAVMGLEEQAELAARKGEAKLHLFYRLWTLKEALVKGLGTGFAIDVSRFQIPPEMRYGDTAGLFKIPHFSSATWGLKDIGSEKFAAALACEVPSGSCSLMN
ncbi:MAG: 4'-phosphopantetheinyl transferase superfamily protein [Gammaproteobacteria bacterium]|nr:4'-phosphopantetheinyl transferase superfamily protein [Gammaproteobacteria bacterium]